MKMKWILFNIGYNLIILVADLYALSMASSQLYHVFFSLFSALSCATLAFWMAAMLKWADE